MKSFHVDPVSGLCGAIFIAIGAFFAVHASHLGVGSTLEMGSGHFPMLLAIVLIGLGLVVVAQGLWVRGEPLGPLAVRSMLLILPAPILFGLALSRLGFLPSLFLTCFVACFASVRMTVALALIVSAAVTCFSVGVFSYGLGLPYPLLGSWVAVP